MKKIFLSLIVIFSLNIEAQTSNWTKDDRNNLFEDCMSYATKYKSITPDQKESICLCYLEDITKKQTKNDFESKIDIELKRLKDAVLTQCGKNIGVDLLTQARVEPIKEELQEKPKPEINKGLISKSFLSGKWKTDNNTIIEFRNDGTFVKRLLRKIITNNFGYIVEDKSTGDWFLDENGTLTLNERWTEDIGKFREKLQGYTTSATYKFVSFSDNYIKFKFIEGNYAENEANVDEKDIIQANRITE